MANKYRHKRTGLIVKWGVSNKYICDNDNVTLYYIPKEVVEGSTEWEEIVPLFDFFGKEIDTSKVHYFIVIDDKGCCHAINDVKAKNNILFPKVKTLAAFRTYEDACKILRLYNFLRSEKELIVTENGNPTQYLKNILKTL